MSSWVAKKSLDFSRFEKLFQPSLISGHVTNYGPGVQELEKYLRSFLDIPDNKSVIVVTNAALGMWALVEGINLHHGQSFRYATSAFTFPCSAQGPLQNSKIVDLLPNSTEIDLSQVGDVDGLIVTNLFGHLVDIDRYTEWAAKNGKILLFDNATAPKSMYHGRSALTYGHGCIVSLHHTKPLGFGEGGVIIVDRQYESEIRKIINFGFTYSGSKVSWDPRGMNAKMSDISAIAHLEYLTRQGQATVDHGRHLLEYWRKLIPAHLLLPDFSDHSPLVSCLAIKNIKPVFWDDHGIVARKYYTPLLPLPEATRLFNDIWCFPCHLDMTTDDLDRIVNLL